MRRGAWYRVTTFAKTEVVLDVNRVSVIVPRSALELVGTLLRPWTVEPRPAKVAGPAASSGDRYAVCPSCCDRPPYPVRRTPWAAPAATGCSPWRGTSTTLAGLDERVPPRSVRWERVLVYRLRRSGRTPPDRRSGAGTKRPHVPQNERLSPDSEVPYPHVSPVP